MLATNISEVFNDSADYCEPESYWRKPIGDGSYDTIKITTEELSQIGAHFLCKAEQRYLYIENPALPFFTMLAEDSGMKIDFTPSAFSGITMFNDNNGYADVHVNVHLSSISTGEKLLGVQALTGPWEGADGECLFLTTPGYIAERFKRLPGGEDMLQTMLSIGLHSYILVQAIMLNRPTIFRQSTARSVTKGTGGKKGKKSRPCVVKTYRVLTLNRDEVMTSATAEGKRIITCPCWGVIGHWRQLKNGKTVWIKPHKKGKLRKTEGVYSVKEYEIVKGEPDVCIAQC
jgi:hypothetical protein